MKRPSPDKKFLLPWPVFISELAGTALLIGFGVSMVILNFGEGSPVTRLVPDPGLRRLLTGFLFGWTGCLIAFSPLGKESGAHMNPAVTLGFWLMGRIRGLHALGYVVAQLVGCVLGALPLLAWGRMGRSVEFGSTFPGHGYGVWLALAGEVVTTFCLIAGLFSFLRLKSIRRFTPLLFPFLYALMVYLEAPVSGTSTNPARSLGPALISGEWDAWWIYWAGPVLGTFLAVSAFRFTWLRHIEIEIAKLYHFDHDPHGVFRWSGLPGKEKSRSD